MNNLLAQVGAPETIDLRAGNDLVTSAQGITFAGLVSGGLSLILVVAAIVFFFILVIGGVKWIMSGGDKAHTEAARNQITAALVGLVIVFAAWAIAGLLGTFLNIDIFNLTVPTATTGGQ
jgi:hypothetical protein